MKDLVTVKDRLELRHGDTQIVAEEVTEKPTVEIKGHVTLTLRERGKLVRNGQREGFNIWTLTGREYLARVMSYSIYGIDIAHDVPARNDRIRYIGFGIGVTPEVSSVTHLVSPIYYANGLFLAGLANSTYPFQTSGSYGTSVRYTREFSETELSVSTTVILTEAGLFTDGSPTSSPPFAPRTRDVTIGEALNQSPAGYKAFEPLKKTTNFVLQTAWEVRF